MENHNFGITSWFFMFANKENRSDLSDLRFLCALAKEEDPEYFEFSVTVPDTFTYEQVKAIAKELAIENGFNKNSRWNLSKI